MDGGQYNMRSNIIFEIQNIICMKNLRNRTCLSWNCSQDTFKLRSFLERSVVAGELPHCEAPQRHSVLLDQYSVRHSRFDKSKYNLGFKQGENTRPKVAVNMKMGMPRKTDGPGGQSRTQLSRRPVLKPDVDIFCREKKKITLKL